MSLAGARRMIPAALLALVGCSGVTSPGGDSGGTVTLQALSLTACARAATPLPGWLNCTGSVTLNVSKTVSSGYVTAIFNYPDGGSFYHGSAQVGAGKPGSVVINVVNQYVAQCATTYATTVDVYDGPDGAQSAPLLASIPTTIHATC